MRQIIGIEVLIDFAFKKVFGSTGNEVALIGLLNTLLGLLTTSTLSPKTNRCMTYESNLKSTTSGASKLQNRKASKSAKRVAKTQVEGKRLSRRSTFVSR